MLLSGQNCIYRIKDDNCVGVRLQTMFNPGTFDTGNLLLLLATAGLLSIVYLLVRHALVGTGAAPGVAAPAGPDTVDPRAKSYDELSAFASYLLDRGEDEKRRLARALHGDLGSTLVAV